MEIGVKITLNNHKMWNFLDQLIHIILPHLIYFNKFNKISYDQSGNLAFGLRDFDIYPEIEWLREFSHILTRLGFITGADIVFIWKTNKNLPKNWKSLFESKSWKSSQTSNFQLFI
jgi:ribosomal protein L5